MRLWALTLANILSNPELVTGGKRVFELLGRKLLELVAGQTGHHQHKVADLLIG